MVSEPFLWFSGSCGYLRRSSAALVFIQSSLSEASHRRHAHSTCNTRISTFCAFNYQRKGIERQNSQSQAKPNQERPEIATHAPPRVGWSFCLMSTRSIHLHAPPRAVSICHVPLRTSPMLTHAPHAPTAFRFLPHKPYVTSQCHVSTRHPLTVDSDRWLWLLTVDRWLWP